MARSEWLLHKGIFDCKIIMLQFTVRGREDAPLKSPPVFKPQHYLYILSLYRTRAQGRSKWVGTERLLHTEIPNSSFLFAAEKSRHEESGPLRQVVYAILLYAVWSHTKTANRDKKKTKLRGFRRWKPSYSDIPVVCINCPDQWAGRVVELQHL